MLVYFLHTTSAAITPGIQPHKVRMKTSRIEPQPLSMTAIGGKMIQNIARIRDIVYLCKDINAMNDDTFSDNISDDKDNDIMTIKMT